MSRPPLLGFLLKRAQHANRTRVDATLRYLDLTAPQYAALAAIAEEAGISNADLSRVAFVTAPTMTGILANLERAGYLRRQPHPNHGRIVQSELTEKGFSVLQEARRHVEAIEMLLAEAVGPAGLPDFADALMRCAVRLSV